MNFKIIVATHKQYDFPNLELYTPIQVGKVLSEDDFGYLDDSTGKSISDKNRSFSELTALYWSWKNNYFVDCDYCGLVHYRRYFSGKLKFGKFFVLSEEEIADYFTQYDIIVPKKRNYYIETIRSHYEHAHYKKDLDTTESIIREMYPDYDNAFREVVNSSKLHLYNMFVMGKEDFGAYMEWLFPILFSLEEEINITLYDDYQKRVFGFLAERLFNVWIVKNNLKCKELPIVNIEGENLLLKAYSMLKRRYGLSPNKSI